MASNYRAASKPAISFRGLWSVAMTTNPKIRATGRSNGASSKGTSVRQFQNRERLLPARVAAVIRLTGALATAVEDLALADLPKLDDDAGFYDQVRHFEISLIKRALSRAQGSQVKAARLLKMRVTTLNTKIKSYEIGMPNAWVNQAESNLVEVPRMAASRIK